MQQIKGIHYKTGQPIAVEVSDGVIQNITALTDPSADLPYIAPGLVDLQVNGFYGFDFNSTFLETCDVEDITRALLSKGVTTYYPTVITNSDAHIKASLGTIAKALTDSGTAGACVGGIHLEGPFISLADGPVGAHDKQYVKAPDLQLFNEYNQAANHKIKIITLSPEWPEAAAFTAECVEQGITVSIGHTAANSEQIAAVAAAGAQMSTHLGNGTHQVLPRHPNYIWDQLADDRLAAGIIGDGFHLPPSVIKVMLKVKGDKAIMVSDSVSLAGMPPGNYSTPVGGRVILTPEGKLHLANMPGTLAGSAQALIQGVSNLYSKGLCSLADAWELASVNPARVMGLAQQQGLQPGAPADMVLFYDDKHALYVSATYKNGINVYNLH